MKPLLELNSSKYLRRLVRELNLLTDGFYIAGQRFTRANVHSMPCTEGKQVTAQAVRQDPDDATKTHSVSISGETIISDAYGRRVCASRSA